MSHVSINLSQNLSSNMEHSVTGMDSSGQRLLSIRSVILTASLTGVSTDVAIKTSLVEKIFKKLITSSGRPGSSQKSRRWGDPAESERMLGYF